MPRATGPFDVKMTPEAADTEGEGLVGLAGRFGIVNAGGKHSCELEYTLSAP